MDLTWISSELRQETISNEVNWVLSWKEFKILIKNFRWFQSVGKMYGLSTQQQIQTKQTKIFKKLYLISHLGT